MKASSDGIFHRLEASKNLPTLPHIILQLIEVCNQVTCTSKEIAEVIDKDLSLTAKVLRMVNSAHYGLPRKVTKIEQAISLLGTDAVKNVAISTAVYHVFDEAKDGPIFKMKVFWWHSLMCATVARLIAKKIMYASPDEAFLSGLLHDIGKLVLWVNFRKEYESILRSSQIHPDYILAEEMQFGATHCQVGAWLINQWHLQSFMGDAVLYHHASVDNILHSLPLVKIIYVANSLYQEGQEGENIQFEIAKEVFGFNRTEVEEIKQKAEEDVNEVAQSLDIEIGPLEVPDKEGLRKELRKREGIIRQVRDMSLLLGTVQNFLQARNDDEILRVAKQGIRTLFDLEEVHYFKYDSEKDILIGWGIRGHEKINLLNEVVIPFQKGKSMLVRSLIRRKPHYFLRSRQKVAPSIIDQQIIRVIGKEGILCLPLVAREQYVGVIVLGIDKTRLSHLSKHVRLLTMLAGQATLAFHAYYCGRRQEEVVQSERLKAVSEIARKVVHEVDIPINAASKFMKILEEKRLPKNLSQERIRIVRGELDRIALLVRGLSDFSEPKLEESEHFDVNALLSDVVRMIRESNLLSSNIKIHLNLEPRLPNVISEKNSLKRVFIILIKNAREAMLDGGNIYITTRHVASSFKGRIHHGASEDLGSLEICISDDGPGISETIKARLYEPFVSTKGEGHPGLGLSTAYRILKEMGATISCKSDRKTGTSFRLLLPMKGKK
jgi:HD-like signal output (HDOD) protein/signal transduction histidine kinase